jgi:DNA-cytosine methyltransferase
MSIKIYGEPFAGIGGASKGLANAGYKPAYVVEWNKSAIDILTANHDVPIAIRADVCSIDYKTLPEVDLLWASPVCCNFSGANHQRGETADDMRSAYAVIHAARRSQSVIIENVPTYFSSNSYRAIKELLQLDGLIFYNTYRLNAARFGNPASRDRTYAVFSRSFFKLKLPQEYQVSWIDKLIEYQEYWQKSKLTKNQEIASRLHCTNATSDIFAIERCGYYKFPKVYHSRDYYPCIKSHTHHDGKNPKAEHGKIGSYRSYMDFIYEGQSYSITPQLLGVLNGFPINYKWGANRAQAAAGIGNAVVPRMAEIMGKMLS